MDKKYTIHPTAIIDESVKIGEGSYIGPGCVILGETVIGKNTVLDQNCRIEDSIIGDNVKVMSSYILKSEVGDETEVGPFAYMRPNSKAGKRCKVGDFVEMKNATMGDDTKASHLTYIGDSDIGAGVNLGCGVVFVNYDGTNKYRTTVDDNAFIGCNTNLVSPVHIGELSYIAAGSTVTEDVEKGALYVARSKGTTIPGWVEKRGLWKGKKK